MDLFPNEDASVNLVVDAKLSWVDQEALVMSKVEETLAGQKLDAILCVAGGWAGGNAASKGDCSEEVSLARGGVRQGCRTELCPQYSWWFVL